MARCGCGYDKAGKRTTACAKHKGKPGPSRKR